MHPEQSRLFTPYTCPDSGVTSYILTERVAPLQEAFYFVNDGSSADGRYLWFYCAWPPSGDAHNGRTLGVVDFQTDSVHAFPETQFSEATPYIAPETGEAFWGFKEYYWRRMPGPEAEVRPLAVLPDQQIGMRSVLRSGTHLTRSADKQEFFLDIGLELQWPFGTISIDGGEYRHWHTFHRLFNHAQFSPTDPDEVLFAQEFHSDPVTGIRIPITDRIWLMRRGESPRPLFPTPTVATHEWWGRDGQHVWYIAGHDGHPAVWRAHKDTAEAEVMWDGIGWHAHDSADGKALVADHVDEHPWKRGGASSVHFKNRDTGKVFRFLRNPGLEGYAAGKCHIDPHPRFLDGGRYISHTTTVLGRIDLALTPVDDLLERTA